MPITNRQHRVNRLAFHIINDTATVSEAIKTPLLCVYKMYLYLLQMVGKMAIDTVLFCSANAFYSVRRMFISLLLLFDCLNEDLQFARFFNEPFFAKWLSSINCAIFSPLLLLVFNFSNGFFVYKICSF